MSTSPTDAGRGADGVSVVRIVDPMTETPPPAEPQLPARRERNAGWTYPLVRPPSDADNADALREQAQRLIQTPTTPDDDMPLVESLRLALVDALGRLESYRHFAQLRSRRERALTLADADFIARRLDELFTTKAAALGLETIEEPFVGADALRKAALTAAVFELLLSRTIAATFD